MVVESTPLPTPLLSELSRQARLRATHYSTRIEGNRLTLEEAEQVIADRRRVFHGRERDVAEVRNYWEALARVEEWAAQNRALTEELIQRIVGIVIHGKSEGGPRSNGPERDPRFRYRRPRLSAAGSFGRAGADARDGELDSSGGAGKISPVVIVGLAHYQFVTIHPYYDGNGRTARLLATLLCIGVAMAYAGCSRWRSITPAISWPTTTR